MKLQQLVYVIEISKYGSLSKAAKSLFISQPNLSNAIKDLEDELGIIIFKRNHLGVELTEDGVIVLDYAKSILNKCDELKETFSIDSCTSFKLIAPNYTPVMESFIKFLKESSNNDNFKCSLDNGDFKKTVDSIYMNNADIGIVAITSNTFEENIKYLSSLNISYTSLGKLGLNINLSKNHPLLKNDVFDFSKLANYSYVDSGDLSKLIGQDPTIMKILRSFKFIDNSPKIMVSDVRVKAKIIGETDAYGLDTTLSPHIYDSYNWSCVKVPGIDFEVGYITNKLKKITSEHDHFISILKENLKNVLL